MREWVDSYLFAKRNDAKPNTIKKIYAPAMAAWCDYCDAHDLHHIESVEPDDVRRWLVDLQERGHSPAYVHQRFRTIRNFFHWWGDEASTPNWRSPMRNVKPPKVPRKVLPPVDGDLVRDIFKRANVRDRAILIVMFTTGLRASELVSVDVADFNQKTGEITVRHGKGDKYRVVPMPQKARLAVRRWLAVRPSGKSDALFTTYKAAGVPGGPVAGERLTYFGLRQITRRHAESVGLKDIGRHSFRRAAVLSYVRAYTPISIIAQIFGWSIKHAEEMVALYAQTTNIDRQTAADRANLDRGF